MKFIKLILFTTSIKIQVHISIQEITRIKITLLFRNKNCQILQSNYIRNLLDYLRIRIEQLWSKILDLLLLILRKRIGIPKKLRRKDLIKNNCQVKDELSVLINPTNMTDLNHRNLKKKSINKELTIIILTSNYNLTHRKIYILIALEIKIKMTSQLIYLK